MNCFNKVKISIIRFCSSSAKLPQTRTSHLKVLVPRKPVPSKIDKSKLPPPTVIDADTIALLERLSLVDCANKQGVETLEAAIAFADQIQQVDTTNVEPLVTVLEDKPLKVRDDAVTEGNCREEILSNAAIVEDEYFIAPPGLLSYRNIIDLCEKHGFVKSLIVSDVKAAIKTGPLGGLLLENLKNEWFFSIVTRSDCSMFFNSNSFSDTFDYAKEVSVGKLPFGIAEIINDADLQNTAEEADGSVSFSEVLSDIKSGLRCTLFVPPASSTHFFHQWQRQRRMWWRIFSAFPGKYSLTDIRNDGNGCQSAEILAEYTWGSHLIESLKLHAGEHEFLNKEQLQTKDGRKNVQAHFVTSNINQSTMVINTLCDAYDEPMFQGKPRQILRLHRKLCPYKISFAISLSATGRIDELNQLAIFLCRQLRGSQISCLLLPTASRNTLESQWCQYDQLGIPYNILLNENTLKNGIAHLRSRDTTLKEQIHISDLPSYVEKLFKNY